MIDDPLALIVQGIFVLAAGMYPVGFLFGVCSDCCGCVCGPSGGDEADWCCSGTHPTEITVRIENGTTISNPGECNSACISGQVVVDCGSIDGDYVLHQDGCEYIYDPEPACGENEEYECDDPPGFAAFVGVQVRVFICDVSPLNLDPVSGPGYNVCLTLSGTPNLQTGLSATWDGQAMLYTFPPAEYRQLFGAPNCDLRGDVDGQASVSGFGDVFFPAGVSALDSCNTCGSVVVGNCDEFWFRDGGAICDGGVECQWDVEILPP